MAKSRPPYPPAFRRQMVELVRTGRTAEELAREFEPTAQAIRNWVAQAERDEGRRADGLSSAEREETGKGSGACSRRVAGGAVAPAAGGAACGGCLRGLWGALRGRLPVPVVHGGARTGERTGSVQAPARARSRKPGTDGGGARVGAG